MKALVLFLLTLCGIAHADSVVVVNGLDANGSVSPSMEIYCQPTMQGTGSIFDFSSTGSDTPGLYVQQDIPAQPNLGPYIFTGEPFLSTASLFTNGVSVTQVNGLNVFCPKYVCDELSLVALDRNL